MVTFHYNGILRNKKDDAFCIGGERRVVLLDSDVTFNMVDLFY